MVDRYQAGHDEDFAEGQVRSFDVDGTWIAVARSGGRLYAFDDECTHEECPLSLGIVEDDQIECDCHGAMFDLRTGAVTSPPATEPITVYPVEIDGVDVVVRLTG